MRIDNQGLKEERRVYTVSELTEDIKILLENTFPSIWVEGEVSNFSQSQAGHIYFSLKDEKANLRCVCFRGVNQQLKFAIKDGLSMIAYGRITLYAPSGQYQLNIQSLEPKGTGALQLAFQQLKEKLYKEGLFEASHKKSLPVLPLRVGVVTSSVGAAIRDILNILRRRAPFVKVILSPVKVQGEGSAQEIAKAVEEFSQYKDVDVLIVGRGGGSMEDLWAFNEEVVARAIYNSLIPVISAVGHEIDTTIADFVADLRAPTPSAAAELVVKCRDELYNEIDNYLSRMRMIMSENIKGLQVDLDHLRQAYVLKYPFNLIQIPIQRLDEIEHRLAHGLRYSLQSGIQRFIRLTGQLNVVSPLNTAQACLQHVKESRHRLIRAIASILQLAAERFRRNAGKLQVLSPLNILARGYSLSFKLPSMEIITDVKAVNLRDKIKTQLGKGSFISQVLSKEGQG